MRAGGELLVEGCWEALCYHGMPSSELVARQVAAYLDTEARAEVARSILRAAALNRLWLLELAGVPEPALSEARSKILGLLDALRGTSLSKLMGVEAAIARAYYEALREVVPEEYGFRARTRRPPEDCFSAALSYGNALLYRVALRSVLRHGLDPRVGFLHVPFRSRPSLALDLAEEFKQVVVDAAVLPLFTTRSMSVKADFRAAGGGVLLSKRGRAKVARAVRHRLNLATPSGTLESLIDRQAARLAAFLRGELQSYEPFTAESCLRR